MTKLLQQVAEIRERAHVCPECEGKGGSNSYEYPTEWYECEECKGTGQVEAPDTDTLCHAVEVLVAAVAVNLRWDTHRNECMTCRLEDDCTIGNELWSNTISTSLAAQNLVYSGLTS